MMQNRKYNLNYKIELEGEDGTIYTIQSYEESSNGKFKDKLESLAVEISLDKNNTNSASSCKVAIYNLSPNTRKNIRKSYRNSNIYRKIKIYAGYEDFITLIFSGTITTALSYRENNNYITNIECSDDYSMVNSFTNVSIKAGFKESDVIKLLAKDLKGVEIGYITESENIFKVGDKGRVYNGKTWDIMNEINQDLDIFIDNNKLYVMGEKEIRTSDILTLDADSGLLQEPKEYDGYLEVKTLFEPLANVNNKVILNSKQLPEYNGDYRLIGVNHNLKIEKIGRETEGTTILKLEFLKDIEKEVKQ